MMSGIAVCQTINSHLNSGASHAVFKGIYPVQIDFSSQQAWMNCILQDTQVKCEVLLQNAIVRA